MGSCCLNKRSGVSNDNVIKVTTKSFEPRETLLNKNTIHTIVIPPQKEFKDFEEYDNHWSGEGVKRIKAYKCSLPIDELQQLRIQFWSSKKESTRIWQILKGCCETDAGTAQQILNNARLYPIDNNLKMVADTDGNLFSLPNYLINDPLFIKEYKNEEEKQEKNVELRIIDVFKNNHYKMIISNLKTGKDLKILLSKAINIDLTKNKLRLIHNGHEVQDDHYLYFFNFEGDNNKIQLMASPIISEDCDIRN